MFRIHTLGDRGRSVMAGPRLVLSLLLALLTTNLWADVRATLDRATITAGDTVTLTIEAEGQQSQGSRPDLSPLEKDFTVLGTSTSQQMQVINGRMSSSAQLHVELEPKHAGRIEIPALRVGGETTRPLTLTIADQPAAVGSQPGSPLYLETEVQPRDAPTFVQQQIQYTARLYYSLPLIDGSLGDPEPEHAVVERLGEGRRYQTTVNGQRYQVIERNYAIFPEQSGSCTIPPVTFTGRVATGAAPRSPFGRMDAMMEQFLGRDPFGNGGFFGNSFGDPGKRVHAISDSVTVEVKPRPAAYSGANWLPAEDLVLHDSWAEQPPEFRAGEPVTRTIGIDAKGLAASQLPGIPMAGIANVRVYPEQPVRESRSDGAVVYGHSEQSFAFVPTQTGRITLPEIRLSWWDVDAGKERVAELPPWNVEVLPGADGVQDTPPVQTPAPVAKPLVQPVTVQPVGHHNTPAADRSAGLGPVWPWLTGACGLLVLASLYLWRRSKRNPPLAAAPVAVKPAAAAPAPAPDPAAAKLALQQACDGNDARAAARALLEWAAAEWPDNPPRNLGAIASRLKSGATEIRRLDQSLYAPGGAVWDGAALGQTFRQGVEKKAAEPSSATGGLAPLYPEWNRRSRSG